jgi:hypothetical protein
MEENKKNIYFSLNIPLILKITKSIRYENGLLLRYGSVWPVDFVKQSMLNNNLA